MIADQIREQEPSRTGTVCPAGILSTMNLLAIETSTERCSVALTVADIVHCAEVDAGQRHSTLLNGMILELLAAHGVSIRQLSGIAFGSGPGSFTGLRIGCSVVQGMALGLDCKVAPVCTLEALALQADADRVITALDARMGETYFAAYERRDANWHAVISPCLLGPDTLPHLDGDGWSGIGSAFDRHDYVNQHFAHNLRNTLPGCFPSAREVARLAVRIFARGEEVLPEEALPLYIRDRVALTVDERLANKAARLREASQ